MRVLELFAGTRSISRAFEKRGHETYSIEWNKEFPDISMYADISTVSAEDIRSLMGGGGTPDVIWASPDCTTFSVMAISKHREKAEDGDLLPKTEYARFCDECDKHVIELIAELNPRFWFIENPVGAMRKMSWMQGLPRHTVTYCQYGESRQKPTDIWTNHPNPRFKPQCKRGAPCHEAAPRGSKCGTQKIVGARDRSRIPDELCDHIVDICENPEVPVLEVSHGKL